MKLYVWYNFFFAIFVYCISLSIKLKELDINELKMHVLVRDMYVCDHEVSHECNVII